MSILKIRKLLTVVETTKTEMGRPIEPPTRKAAALAVIENPFAGHDSDDLSTLIDIGDELGGLLGQMAVAALGIDPSAVESYGKAAIVGEQGELEHAAAILHPFSEKPTSKKPSKAAGRGGVSAAVRSLKSRCSRGVGASERTSDLLPALQ